jgi:putative transcriptional regulator
MRKEVFEELITSVKEAGAINLGDRPAARLTRSEELLATDVVALRRHFGLSQAKFAVLLGISVDTLQNWEQSRRQPEGPAKVLLRIAAVHPEALLSVAAPKSRRHRNRSSAKGKTARPAPPVMIPSSGRVIRPVTRKQARLEAAEDRAKHGRSA